MQNIVYDGKNYVYHSDAHIYRVEGEKKTRIKKAEWLAIKVEHEAREGVSALEGQTVEANPETPPEGENAPTLGEDGLVIKCPLMASQTLSWLTWSGLLLPKPHSSKGQ